jgi:glycosyltransferase involved in cell wall biosynthesis
VSVVDTLARHLQADGHRVVIFHPVGSLILRKRRTQLGLAGAQLRLTMPFGRGLKGVLRTIVAPFLLISNLLQLLWYLRSDDIQIVNLHYAIDNYVYFAVCRYLLPIKLVTSLHGGDAFYHEQPLASYPWSFKLLVNASDLIVLPSDAYRRKFIEAFPQVQQRAIFVHNGINPLRFSPSEKSSGPLGRYILCVAELQEYKAIDILMLAAKPILLNDESLTLVLAGDGPLRSDLELLSSSLGIRHRTMFLGTQGPPEIATLLRGCEVMVLPSRTESFGLAVIEAMACKAPVIATNVGGIPEIIEHEISGILVEPEDPDALTAGMQRVLTDRNLRNHIAENGYSRVMERFCASHNGRAYSDALVGILSTGRATPQAKPAVISNYDQH